MVSPRIYLPIHPPLTTEAILRLSQEQLETRSLNDPRYAGYDCNFDWRPLVTLNIADPKLRADTMECLDQMAATAEGQQTLRQAYAIHQILCDEARAHPNGAVAVSMHDVGPTLLIRDAARNSGTHSNGTGIIEINPTDIAQHPYIGTDGKLHAMSLNNALDHEFGHLKDGFAILPAYAEARAKLNERAMAMRDAILRNAGYEPKGKIDDATLPPSLRRSLAQWNEYYNGPYEHPVMSDTNPHMAKFGEQARALTNHMPDGSLAPTWSAVHDYSMHHGLPNTPTCPTPNVHRR